MIQRILLLLIVSLFTYSTSAFASYADCGLGSTVLKDKSIVSQTFAYTTNGTSHITSVVTQTSGCDFSGVVQKEKLQEFYITKTYINLEEDAARGEGPYLTGLAELMDCSPEAHGALAQLLQSNFDQIFKEKVQDQETGKAFLQKIKQDMIKKPALASLCKVS
ncbi:MAG: DUF3015 family protein [SAR324 cluster bacterium]|nr:DUF3015 family protein [SAR324 cluster bacterium]